MNEAEQIVGFLQRNRPNKYCDDFIADESGLRHQRAQRVTISLGLTDDYIRQSRTYYVCKNDRPKLVIHADSTRG
jgi:hypothetical protein